MNRQDKIEACIKAARRRCPTIVPRNQILCTDGKWYYPFGIPNGVKSTNETRIAGYVYQMSDGTTYGKLATTEQELIDRHENGQNADAEGFRIELNKMTDQEINNQYNYWCGKERR